MTKQKSSVNINYIVGGLLLFGLLIGLFLYRDNNKVNDAPNKNTCLADDCLEVDNLNYPVGELPPAVKQALDEAIMDEYKALAVYQAIIAKFGQVRPFSMIKGAEEQHIASLKSIYDKYGQKIPTDKGIAKLIIPNTIKESCQMGVEAEIANATLYREKLMPAVVEYDDITRVFSNLMNASQLKHLPAFERCN